MSRGRQPGPATVDRAQSALAYELHDASGALVAIHERHNRPDGSKRFSWRRPDGTPGLAGRPAAVRLAALAA